MATGLGTEYVHTFEARGRCKGKAWANHCRSAARDYIVACFGDAWQQRRNPEILSGSALPGRCLPRGSIGVQTYNLHDLKGAIERAACRLGVEPNGKVNVTGMISGDKGCSVAIPIVRYSITPGICN